MYTLLDGFEENASKGDRAIIRLINSDPEKYINLSITEFSNTINSAISTVSKFVRRLGFNDYRSFQNHVSKAYYLKKDNQFYFPIKENERDIVKIKNFDFYAINETVRKINPDVISKFIDSILKAKKIWCIGMGDSYLAAKDFSAALNLLGLISYSTNDIYGEVPKLKLMVENDLLIFFSERFGQKDYIRLINMVKQFKVKVAVITAVNDFFISKDVDYVINFFAFPRQNRPELIRNAKVQQIFVNNYIINTLIKRDDKFSTSRKNIVW